MDIPWDVIPMAQDTGANKGLRRFRAALAEIEKEMDICPDCDTSLTPVLDLGSPRGPGDVAGLMPYKYCERCQAYFLHGQKGHLHR